MLERRPCFVDDGRRVAFAGGGGGASGRLLFLARRTQRNTGHSTSALVHPSFDLASLRVERDGEGSGSILESHV